MAESFSFEDLLLVLPPPLLALCLCLKYSRRSRPSSSVLPVEWPVVGMLPSILANLHRLHDYFTTLLAASGCSFEVRGPPASSVMRFFVTCDPANARHIFVSNFANYPKGEEFAAIFDVMGDSFFNADGESWRRQRTRVQHLLANPRLLAFMAGCCRDKVEKGLLPFLDNMARTQTVFDLQELFAGLTFNMTAMPVFGVDPGLLSIDVATVAKAMDAVMEVGFFRHTVPVSLWKLMRHLNIGPERKLAAARMVLRRFVTEMIEQMRVAVHTGDGELVRIASSYVDDPEYVDEDQKPNDFLYATLINYMVAGRDTAGTTLSWLFYNLMKHPRVVANIRKELAPIASCRSASSSNNGLVMFQTEETKPLVYLQAALFESMRLYPPGPIERKAALADDVLPSGHGVRAGDTVLISLYSMGRMEGVWGEDCGEYRPERWVTADGKLRHVPAYKFLAFNAGPRSCLGKDIAVLQMKSIIAAVVWNFDLEMLRGQVVEPKMSVVLQMKGGLMVKAKKREIKGSVYACGNVYMCCVLVCPPR